MSEMAGEMTDELHARAVEGRSLGDVLEAHLECLIQREAQIRWLLREAPALPKTFLAPWIALQSAVSFHISTAAERDMALGSIRRMPLHLLFNTWVGLVHHYLVNQELFAPGRSVLREHGQVLHAHFLSLVSNPSTKAKGAQ